MCQNMEKEKILLKMSLSSYTEGNKVLAVVGSNNNSNIMPLAFAHYSAVYSNNHISFFTNPS